MNEIIRKFVEALKEKLHSIDPAILLQDDGGFHGDTIGGFYSEKEIDMDELDAQIDEFAASFKDKP